MSESNEKENKPQVDAIFQMLLHTLQELWVIKDRQLILERVLDEAGLNASRLVDDYQPDAELVAHLDEIRREMLHKCLQPASDDD